MKQRKERERNVEKLGRQQNGAGVCRVEWLERLNWADLGEDGDFYAEYLVLETDGLSDDDVINQFEALGWLITEDEKRTPVSLGVWIDWKLRNGHLLHLDN